MSLPSFQEESDSSRATPQTKTKAFLILVIIPVELDIWMQNYEKTKEKPNLFKLF
jgi:hypothetical protein